MAKWFGTTNRGIFGHVIIATGISVMGLGLILWIREGMIF